MLCLTQNHIIATIRLTMTARKLPFRSMGLDESTIELWSEEDEFSTAADWGVFAPMEISLAEARLGSGCFGIGAWPGDSVGEEDEEDGEAFENETEAREDIRQTRCHHVTSFSGNGSTPTSIGIPATDICCTSSYFRTDPGFIKREAEVFLESRDAP